MKNIVLFIIICLVLVSCNSKNTSQILVVKIYNYNSSSPKTGEVVQYSCQKNDLIHYKTNNGTVEIPLPQKGMYFLKFIGDNEETNFFSLYIEGKNDCELIVHLPKTKARPNFTPEYLSYPNIKFSNASSTTNRFAEIMLDDFKNNALSMDSLYYYQTNKKNLAPYVMRYSREILDRLKIALNTEKNTLVRGQLYINYLSQWHKIKFKNIDSLICEMVLKEIEPNSQLWSSNPNLLTIALAKTKQNINNSLYVISAIKNNDDPNVKSEILSCQLQDAEDKKNENSARQLANRILKEFPQTSIAKEIKDKYYGTIPGKIIPEFKIPSLTKNGETISKKSMLGKIYLIDFWATWCGPCLNEMPYLHDAYKKYSSKGLEILSIAFDQKDKVEKFRSKKWRLPWLNSVVEDGFSSQIAKSFSISGIPKPILISKDGKILAVDEELRGDKLNKTLEKYIN